ncbi:MAG: hypothetical protein U0V73_11805 [Acidimicrobiia bacterium]
MCDTLCAITPDGALFAKNSDRPPGEQQVVERHAPRSRGGTLRTQCLEIPDAGACAVVGSRPTWLWGFEHGVNERRVAIGNEKIWTVDDARAVPPALIGMDLVRLGLERGRDATDALDHMISLLESYGQGGSGERDHDEPYFSSFLVCDPTSAWVLETSGRTWAARPVVDRAAISNRVTITTDWTRASTDVTPGRSFDDWRDPEAPTGVADQRLATTTACLAEELPLTPERVAGTLRDHGDAPWGAIGTPAPAVPPPTGVDADWHGITVCMHLRDYQATTASMIARLPANPDEVARGWFALGSPCASVYVPAFLPDQVPPDLADALLWARFAALRDRVEADGAALDAVRAVLGPLEAELWHEADSVADDPGGRARFTASVGRRVDDALRTLGV